MVLPHSLAHSALPIGPHAKYGTDLLHASNINNQLDSLLHIVRWVARVLQIALRLFKFLKSPSGAYVIGLGESHSSQCKCYRKLDNSRACRYRLILR